ncbi:MAG: PIG-L deacetylase family protein [Bacteriovoracaceae bacterium]
MKKSDVLPYIKCISENYWRALKQSPKKYNLKTLKSDQVVLLVSPHPDDEAISGGLALRLKNELGFCIINVPFSLGSKVSRQSERLEELKNACQHLGFTLTPPLTKGSEKNELLQLIGKHKPSIVITCHDQDGHKTHEECSRLVQQALQESDFKGKIVFHEFWQPQKSPNLLLELSEDNVSKMVEALLFHQGEIERNPYHLRLPFTLADNSRRGSELVGGVEKASQEILYSVLLTLGKMQRNAFVADSGKIMISSSDELFLTFGN